MRSLTISGLILMLTGFGCYGAGAFVLMQTLDRNRLQEEVLFKGERSCREQILKLGAKVIPLPSNVLEVVFDNVKDPLKSLGDETATLAMCPTRRIVESCTGVGCTASGSTPATLTSNVRTVFKLGTR